MRRDYILRSPEPGIRGRTIMHVTSDGGRESGTAVLWLPDGTSPETMGEVLDALRKAREEGREERAAELIPGDIPADRQRRLVREAALSAIAEWGPGWTDSSGELADDGQYRINLVNSDEASHTIDLTVGKGRYDEAGRYRVRVLVEEIEQR